MEQAILTNREIASLLLLGLILLFVVTRPNRSELLDSVRAVLKSIWTPKIAIPLVLYVVWIAVAVVLGARWGFWDSSILKATILWVLLSGLALIANLNKAIDKPGFFREAILKAVGVVALVEFLSTLRSFPLWIELLAQAFALICVAMDVAGERNPETAPHRRFANGYLALFGISALVWAMVHLIASWSELDHLRLVREFALPIWLTPWALVFVYLYALCAAYESAFVAMRFQKREGFLLRPKLVLLIRSNISLGRLRVVRGTSVQTLAASRSFREAWGQISDARRNYVQRLAEEGAARRRLIDNAGVQGTDDSGRRLDQREFEETRRALEFLATCHMGHYRRASSYRRDLLPIVEPGFDKNGLPSDHGVRMYVSTGGQEWYAERQTITGWWFAIGASGPPPSQWYYDGSEPPTGYPSQLEWDQYPGEERSVNWTTW